MSVRSRGGDRLGHTGWSRKDRGQYQKTIGSESYLKGGGLRSSITE